jgi:ferritin
MKMKVEDILNRQVERVAYSSGWYLAMASWAEVNRFAGGAVA